MWSGIKRSGDTIPGRTISYCPVSVLLNIQYKWKFHKNDYHFDDNMHTFLHIFEIQKFVDNFVVFLWQTIKLFVLIV